MAVTIDGTNGITSPDFEPSSSTTPTNGLFLPTTNALGFATNSAERLRLDASGNLGLGVTPSAWSSGRTAIQLGGSTSSNFAGGLVTTLKANTYYNGGDLYTATGFSSQYVQSSGTHAWYTAPSGTAGAAISFTQAMTLDASGNLVVGPATAVGGNAGAITSSGPLTASGYLSTHQTSRAVMEYNGNKCTLRAYGGTAGTGYWAFNVGGGGGSADTQAMMLDASGNLLVGTTSANAILTTKALNNNASTFALYCMNSSSTQLFKVRDDGLIETGTATNSPYNYTTGSSANTFVNSSGQFQRSTSSARYKNSITDAVHGLAEVLKLRPVTYKGNNDGDTVFGGLIAEEVHDVGLTEFVQYNDDGEPDALAYGNMVSLAFKAIQELNQRLEALENK